MAGKYDKGRNVGGGGGGGKGGNDGGKEKFTLPGPRDPDYPLCTLAQIKHADLSELRKDERIWAAYERGWFDLMTSYMSSQLMQGEMPVMYGNNGPVPVYPADDRTPRSLSPTGSCWGECHGRRGQCCCKCEAANEHTGGPRMPPAASPRQRYPRPAPHPVAPTPPVVPRPAAPVAREGGPRPVGELIITVKGCSSDDPDKNASMATQSTVKIRIVSPESTEVEVTTTTTTTTTQPQVVINKNESPIPPEYNSESDSDSESFSDFESE